MLDFDPSAVPWLLTAWLVLISLLIVDLRSDQSNGLPLVFAANLIMLHLPGGGILLVDWYQYYPKSWTYNGFVYTTLFLALFVAGGAASRVLQRLQPKVNREVPKSFAQLRAAGLFLTVFGGLAMLALKYLPGVAAIPSVGTVVGVFWTAAAAGMCLYLYAFHRMEKAIPLRVFLISFSFPILTMILLGFLGFGLSFVIALGSFFMARRYANAALLLLSPIVIYVGLSFGVNYFDKRAEIREAGWLDRDELATVVQASKIFTEFEWFDVENASHLRYLDSRLNQNFLVGANIEALAQGKTDLLAGETFTLALVAWIPRAIWPGKPVVAGSSDIVARATGLDFDQDTSIGVGSVLEFNANFGVLGMCAGAFIFGFLMRAADRKAANMLQQGKLFSWLIWYLMGYALTNAGGQIAESIALIAASWVAVLALRFSHQVIFGNRVENQESLA